jgi:hypothetical protein
MESTLSGEMMPQLKAAGGPLPSRLQCARHSLPAFYFLSNPFKMNATFDGLSARRRIK